VADKKKEEKKEAEKEEKASAKDAKEGEAPAEGAEGEAAAAEGGKKKLPMKLIIIGGVGALVLIIIIVAALFLTGVLGGKKPAADPNAAAHAETGSASEAPHGGGEAEGGDHKKEGDKKEGATFFDLGEMIVNLNTDGKRQTFLKLVVQLELENAADKAVMENLKPRIVDTFQTYMRELRVDDLRGSAGLYRLREELLFRVTEAVHPIKVRDVLFQQMLVQ
jgi:flagellar FliL protein